MKTALHVVDISPCVYAGSFNKRSFIQGMIINTPTGYRERNIPTGGTSILFNIIGNYSSTGPIVFVADRNPTIKKDSCGDYKGNRTHPDNVSVEKEVAEYILSDCGFPIYARDGYEADDLIYTIVAQNKRKYDHIFVHTADSDLYLLVDDNVTILPTSSQAKLVTRDNYSYTCKKGKEIPYNSVVFRKFLEGDPSKNLEPLPKEERARLRSLFYTPARLPLLGNPRDIRILMHRTFPEYDERVNLFYPMYVDEVFEITQDFNYQRVKEWAYEIGNRVVHGTRGDLSAQIQEMLDRALYVE